MSRWFDLMTARFDDLYAQVPDAGCKGLCQESCGPLAMHPFERARVVCRLYGAADDLRCEHGCKPAGGYLPSSQARRLVTESISGQSEGAP